LVQNVQTHAPDVVVCHVAQVDEGFFSTVALLQSPLPRPLLVFTQTDSADATARAVACGIHAYVVNGYAPQRLRALITLAQARCQYDQTLRDEVLDLTRRFEERKAVDRAKGILMHARQVSDDDAYRMLRTASMHSNQRLGEVSQQVIESAHFADAVNRAGQLRMLSQRLVKLYVLQLNAMPSASLTSPTLSASLALHKSALKASVKRVDEILIFLDKSLSSRTSVLGESSVGDSLAPLLQALLATWLPLKKALHGVPQSVRIAPIDLLAEQLLQEAEHVTLGLEQAGAVAPLHVLNLAGRQRMLSQRFAKQALLAALYPELSGSVDANLLTEAQAATQAVTQAAFEQALQTLNGLPLTTPAIRTALDEAALGWQTLLAGATDLAKPSGCTKLAHASESLLDVFEALSTHYERSMQMLMG
jgi:AmiR/NasT family two-component response regulator